MIRTQKEIENIHKIIKELFIRFDFTYNLFEDSILWNYAYGSRVYKVEESFINKLKNEFESEGIQVSSFTIKEAIKYYSIDHKIIIQYLESLEEWNPSNPSEIKKVISGIKAHNQALFEEELEKWFLAYAYNPVFKGKSHPTATFKNSSMEMKAFMKLYNKLAPRKVNELFKFCYDYYIKNELSRFFEESNNEEEFFNFPIIDVDESLDFETDKIYSEALYRVLKQNNKLHLYSWYSHSENSPKRRFIEV